MAPIDCASSGLKGQRGRRLISLQLQSACSYQQFRSPFALRHGVTLLEITLSLAIISIISAMAYPAMSRLLDGIHVRGTATEIHSLFTAARHHAITRSERVTLQIDTARAAISMIAGTDTLRARTFLDTHGVTLSANRASFTYSPIGVGYGAGNMTLIVRRNARVDSVFVSRLGRVRLD